MKFVINDDQTNESFEASAPVGADVPSAASSSSSSSGATEIIESDSAASLLQLGGGGVANSDSAACLNPNDQARPDDDKTPTPTSQQQQQHYLSPFHPRRLQTDSESESSSESLGERVKNNHSYRFSCPADGPNDVIQDETIETIESAVQFSCSSGAEDNDSYSGSASISRSVTPPNDQPSSANFAGPHSCTCQAGASFLQRVDEHLESKNYAASQQTAASKATVTGPNVDKHGNIRSLSDIFGRTFVSG